MRASTTSSGSRTPTTTFGLVTAASRPGWPTPSRLCSSLASLDLPTTTPVYFTVDFPCPDGNQIDAYFRGVNSVLPVAQIGAYGNYTIIDWLYQHGLATYFCESDAWREPAGWHPQAQMHQYTGTYHVGGVSVDRLTVTAADFGQCRRHEESDPRLSYSGSWTPSGDPAGAYSGGAVRVLGRRGASVTVGFYGTSLDWVATTGPDGGSARVTLDGVDVATVTLYSGHSAVPAEGLEQRPSLQRLRTC